MGPTTADHPDRSPGAVALDLVLVHDHSGSVREDEAAASIQMDVAKGLLRLLGLDARGRLDRVAFVGFGSADEVVELPMVSLADDADRERLVARIEAAGAHRGWTDYEAALGAAVDALTRADRAYERPPFHPAGRAAAVLLLTDGVPELDDLRRPDLRAVTSTGSIAHLLAEREWPVCPVHLAPAPDASAAAGVLRRIAEATGGRSAAVGAAKDVAGVCVAMVAALERRHGRSPVAIAAEG